MFGRVDRLERKINDLAVRMDSFGRGEIRRLDRRTSELAGKRRREEGYRDGVEMALWVSAIEFVPIEDRVAWVDDKLKMIYRLRRDLVRSS